ncbi:MAG: hypothetical protein K2O38_08010, partial [Muribaculaceae bacterium]|nr:hypothetical protein [Muribaculaceae bacterium]
MREASERRTVTDTDSYAFFSFNNKRQREDDRGFLLLMKFNTFTSTLAGFMCLSMVASAQECKLLFDLEGVR